MGNQDNNNHKIISTKTFPRYTIGIPRALYFFKYGVLWKAFLENLGHKVLFSPPTTSKIVDMGTEEASSELCVPMKIYFGHIRQLIREYPKLDYIFIPRYVSTQAEQYFCPKFLILPESVKHGINLSIPILTLEFNAKEMTEIDSLLQFGTKIGHSKEKIIDSWHKAKIEFLNFKKQVKTENYISELTKIDEDPSHNENLKHFKSRIPADMKGKFPIKILLLGHPYNVYENYININLIDRLKVMDCTIYTIENMPDEIFQKPVFINDQYHQYWQTEDEILKTAQYFLTDGREEIDGVIFLISFACGPDSLIQEIVMRNMKKHKIPYLNLVLDEHSGESGMVTRIESFIDMLRRKKY